MTTAFLKEATDMIMGAVESPDAPEAYQAILVCQFLHVMFSTGGSEADKATLERMASILMRPPKVSDRGHDYRRAVMHVAESAARLQADPGATTPPSAGMRLIFRLVHELDGRLTHALPAHQQVTELLRSYEEQASGVKGKRGAVRILAEIIVLAGGLDAPKNTVDQWQRLIHNAVRRTYTQTCE